VQAKGYAKLGDAQRKDLQQAPMVWAALRAAWPELTDADKKKLRDEWAQTLVKVLPQQPAQPATAKAPTSDEAYQRLSSASRANHNLAMSMLQSGYNNTISQMAAMSGRTTTTTYTQRYW
jgi:hypothetical protein